MCREKCNKYIGENINLYHLYSILILSYDTLLYVCRYREVHNCSLLSIYPHMYEHKDVFQKYDLLLFLLPEFHTPRTNFYCLNDLVVPILVLLTNISLPSSSEKYLCMCATFAEMKNNHVINT